MKYLYIVRYQDKKRKEIVSFEQPFSHIGRGSTPLTRKFHDEHHNRSKHYSATEWCSTALTSNSI